jgi:hypothetical protein
LSPQKRLKATALRAYFSPRQRLMMIAALVLFAQLVHQMIKVGRGLEKLRPYLPLQPFAHGIADRSAGFAIDPFDDIVK